MNPDVVSLGEPMVEFNATDSGSLREVRNYQVGWGGDTSNFAVGVSRLGGRAGYITRLGDDDFGQTLLDLWKSEGVDTSHVIREVGGFTGIYFISRRGGSHSFTYYRQDSAASHLTPEDLPRSYIAQAKVLYTSGISQAISNSACDTVFQALEIARQAGVTISYDPNLRLKLWPLWRARAVILQTIGLANLIFPSLEDARLLTGLEEPEAIARDLLARGPTVIVLKMGEEGALLATEYGIQRFEPFKVDTVDASGAGDTFDAAFVVAYLDGQRLSDCVRFANAAAALTTTGWGCVTPIPRREEVEALMRSAAPN